MPFLPHLALAGTLLQLPNLTSVCMVGSLSVSYVLTLAADIVQDLYLRELRAYKPAALKATDAEGHVQKFTMPKVPRSPEETSLSSQMKEYEDSVVEVEGQDSAGEVQAPEGDYFEDLKDFDEKPAAH
jgi:F-type H+-transporting ATPase subunit h